MKEIELSKGGKYKGKFITLVDDEDYEWLNQYNWCIEITKYKNTYYARRSIRISVNVHTTQRMHHLILGVKGGDHTDRNGLNNQRANLRLATHHENCMNRNSQRKSSSKFKGVSWNKINKKWMSRIMFNNKSIFLGNFISETEAANVYDIKAKELFGEFAHLNNAVDEMGIDEDEVFNMETIE
jgi:AP2-like factor (euAP2 lineage)